MSAAVSATAAFPSLSLAFDQTITHLKTWAFDGCLTDTCKQTVITQRMKEQISREFKLDCTPDEQDRVTAVGLQTIPTRSSESLLCTTLSPQPDNLSQCPMSLFELMCPFELSDQAFVTCLSICLGIPVPHARILRTQPAYSTIDPWANFLLNDSAHASRSRHASHDKLAYLLANLASTALKSWSLLVC